MIFIKHTYATTITGWFDSSGPQFSYPVPPSAEAGDIVLFGWLASIDTGFSWGFSNGTLVDTELFDDTFGPGFGDTNFVSGYKILSDPIPQSLTYGIDPNGHGDGNHVVIFILLGGVDAGVVNGSAGVNISGTATTSFDAPAVTATSDNSAVFHFAGADSATFLGVPGTDSPVRQASVGSGITGRTLAVSMQHVPTSGSVAAATFTDSLSSGTARYMGTATVSITPKSLNALYPLPIARRSNDVDWRFFLANSSDMSSIGELDKARGAQLTLTLNRGGSLTFQYNGEDELAEDIIPLNRCVIAYRDGVPRWSGPIWSIQEDVPSNNMQIGCVGWIDFLAHRILAPTMEPYAQFVNMDAGQIGMNLLCFANGREATSIVETLIKPGQIETSQIRTRSYKRFQNIGQEIQALGDIESGYDFEVTTIERRLNIWRKRMRDLTATAVFGYKAGPIHNLESVTRQISGDRTVNGIYVVGNSQAATLPRQDDPLSQATYGLMEEQVALSEVVDPVISLAYAAGELVYRSQPPTIYTIKPMPWIASNPERVPRALEDYEVGDLVSFSANQGRIQVVNQAARVFQIGIAVENRTEKVTLQTTLGSGS